MKYQILYADPPWKYRVYDESDAAHGAATSHYPTMTLDEMKALPVQSITDKNCALFMWVTPPLLPEGIELMQAWGFRYVTKAFNWVKLNGSGTLWMGLGHYTRGNSEDCLLGMKGSLPRADAGVEQVVLDYDLPETVTTYRVEHSKKPEEVRDRIVRLFGDLPRIELFSRQKRPGWDVLGNGIDGRDIRESLAELETALRDTSTPATLLPSTTSAPRATSPQRPSAGTSMSRSREEVSECRPSRFVSSCIAPPLPSSRCIGS